MTNAATNGRKTADFIIVGAGVMGTSIAFHLAQRKAGRILILDKAHAGNGGSGRSSALVRMHYSFPPEVQLALISLRMFENWTELVGEPALFRKTGFVRIVQRRAAIQNCCLCSVQQNFCDDHPVVRCVKVRRHQRQQATWEGFSAGPIAGVTDLHGDTGCLVCEIAVVTAAEIGHSRDFSRGSAIISIIR